MKLTLEINSRTKTTHKMMAFLGHMEIIELDTTGLHKTGFEETVTVNFRPEVWHICSVPGHYDDYCHVALYQFQSWNTLWS